MLNNKKSQTCSRRTSYFASSVIKTIVEHNETLFQSIYDLAEPYIFRINVLQVFYLLKAVQQHGALNRSVKHIQIHILSIFF